MSAATVNPALPTIHAHNHRGDIVCRWTLHRREDFAFMIVGKGPHLCTGEEVPVRVDYVTSTDRNRAAQAVADLQAASLRDGGSIPAPDQIANAVLAVVFDPTKDSLRLQRVRKAIGRWEDQKRWEVAHPRLSRLPQPLRRCLYP